MGSSPAQVRHCQVRDYEVSESLADLHGDYARAAPGLCPRSSGRKCQVTTLRATPQHPPSGANGRTHRELLRASLLLACIIGLAPASSRAAPGDITTVAGGPGEGPATSVGQRPVAVAVRGSAVYIVDNAECVVR